MFGILKKRFSILAAPLRNASEERVRDQSSGKRPRTRTPRKHIIRKQQASRDCSVILPLKLYLAPICDGIPLPQQCNSTWKFVLCCSFSITRLGVMQFSVLTEAPVLHWEQVAN